MMTTDRIKLIDKARYNDVPFESATAEGKDRILSIYVDFVLKRPSKQER